MPTAPTPPVTDATGDSAIVVYGFGPWMGLPDGSHFVTKTEIQLKMAGLSYVKEIASPATGPKGKLPYLRDIDGSVIADSTFIRTHLERRYGCDLDAALNPRQRAEAWALERMLEDHLGWAMGWFRWIPEENYRRGPARAFDTAPAELQDDLRNAALARQSTAMLAHGIGRHRYDEVAQLGLRSLNSLAVLLGDGEYLFGTRMSAVDATAAAVLAGIVTPDLDSPLRARAVQLGNLVDYSQRMTGRFFPPVPRYIAPRKAGRPADRPGKALAAVG